MMIYMFILRLGQGYILAKGQELIERIQNVYDKKCGESRNTSINKFSNFTVKYWANKKKQLFFTLYS